MSRANTNAKKEFLLSIGSRPVKCAVINYAPSSLWEMEDINEGPPQKSITLPYGHNETELENFLEELNFEYDAGYGGQELDGTVWFSSSKEWMTRWEYDGSEGWEIHSMPEIPDELLKIFK